MPWVPGVCVGFAAVFGGVWLLHLITDGTRRRAKAGIRLLAVPTTELLHCDVVPPVRQLKVQFEVPADSGQEFAAVLMSNDAQSCDNYFNLKGCWRQAEIVGLDAEWQPDRKGRPNRLALLQLAVGNECYLFHLVHMTHVPSQVIALLENPNIIKTGVGIAANLQKLAIDYGVLAKGVLDVRDLVKAVDPCALKTGSSLQALGSSLLGIQFDRDMQCNNWAARGLTDHQIAYAACDAWMSQALVYELYDRRATVHTDADAVSHNVHAQTAAPLPAIATSKHASLSLSASMQPLQLGAAGPTTTKNTSGTAPGNADRATEFARLEVGTGEKCKARAKTLVPMHPHVTAGKWLHIEVVVQTMHLSLTRARRWKEASKQNALVPLPQLQGQK